MHSAKLELVLSIVSFVSRLKAFVHSIFGYGRILLVVLPSRRVGSFHQDPLQGVRWVGYRFVRLYVGSTLLY